MQQTLPHALLIKSHLLLLASPICTFRSKNTCYSLLNSPHSVHSYCAGTSFRLTYTAPSLYNLPPLQTTCSTVSSLQNILMTSIRATNSAYGGRNGRSIKNARIPTKSFMANVFSYNPIKLLTDTDIFNGQMNFH